MRKFLRMFNWPMIIAWGGGVGFSVAVLIYLFSILGPMIGKALH